LQFGWIHVAGVGQDVHKNGLSACLGDGFGGGDEGVGHGDDRVPCADAGRHEGKPQGVRAGVEAHTVAGIAESGELRFKRFHLGTADEHAVGHGVLDHGQDVVFDLLVLNF
jgi:hypothetical protein